MVALPGRGSESGRCAAEGEGAKLVSPDLMACGSVPAGNNGEALEPTRGPPVDVSLRGPISRLRLLDLKGKEFSVIGDLLADVLISLYQSTGLHSKSQTMGEGSNSLFPLPLSAVQDPESPKGRFVRAMCIGLNTLYGAPVDEKRSSWSRCRSEGVKHLETTADELLQLGIRLGDIDFDCFFRSKGVDYSGEEVKVAQFFCWEAIEASFPLEVGKLDLVSFCTLGVRHYVEHFEEFLLPVELQQIGRAPRVMVAQEHWFTVCQGLLKSGVCGVMPIKDLYSIGGVPLLSGLFAVGKGEFKGQMEIQRLIMNLIPLNQICRGVRGDVGTLPGVSGLGAVVLGEGEVALLSSEDIRCFFYLFAVPEPWYRFLGFNKLVPEALVPGPYQGLECVLFAKVLPMGFVNSVGIAQHIHRNVIRWAS